MSPGPALTVSLFCPLPPALPPLPGDPSLPTLQGKHVSLALLSPFLIKSIIASLYIGEDNIHKTLQTKLHDHKAILLITMQTLMMLGHEIHIASPRKAPPSNPDFHSNPLMV